MDKLHYIHSRGGRIGGRADTQPQDVDAIVATLAKDERRHLILHFHGGLVSKAYGLATARKLLPVYSPAPNRGGYPVFFVWESGAWESIRNNFTELADEPVFRQLLRKATQYALERVGLGASGDVSRSFAQASIGSREGDVKREFERFWTAPSKDTIPFRDLEVIATTPQARSGAQIDEAEVQADLEGDTDFHDAFATLPNLSPKARSAFAATPGAEHRSTFSEAVSQDFSTQSGARGGVIEFYVIAKFLVRVVRGIVERYWVKRDHGFYATCLEEVVRALRFGGSGLNEWAKALSWNRMKQDTEDAFNPDPNLHAGTALLDRLAQARSQGLELRRITLVGHSAGSLYAANWLERSARFLPPDFKHDMVFLAPGITYDRMAQILRNHQNRIGNFRMFAMQDAHERDDQVWGRDEALKGGRDLRRFLYPSSLLYLVSGILESSPSGEDEPDVPLLGMERFLSGQVYPDNDFPAVRDVRAWLSASANRTVWAVAAEKGLGLNCDCVDHGAFDENDATRQSLEHIVGLQHAAA